MADEKDKTASGMDALLEDVPTRFEGGSRVLGVPVPKAISEPFKAFQEPPTTEFSAGMDALLEEARPTASQRMEQVALGTLQGAGRDMPVAAGALAGAQFGIKTAPAVAPVLGPLTPAYPVATTLFGIGAGYLFGQELDRWFPAVPRDDLVPYREGGKTFGSALSTAPAAFGIPYMTGNRVSRFLSAVGESARRSPGVFMATEAGTAAAMGVAGGTAEAFFPGQTGARLGAEVTAGVLSPGRLLVEGANLTKQGLQYARGAKATQSARMEDKAVNILLDALEKNKEDPAALIAALRQQLPRGVAPTAAQKTASPTLMDLEKSLGDFHKQFGAQTAKQGKDAMDAYELLVKNLQTMTGNPAALRAAAQLRDTRFRTVLDARLAQADANSAMKIAQITKDTPGARAQIGDIIKTETELALSQSRMAERELWTEAIRQLTTPVQKKTLTTVQSGWDYGKDRPKTVTFQDVKLVAPSLAPRQTADMFLARAAEVGDAVYDQAVPDMVRRIMDSFGLDQAAVQKYKLGRNTQEFLDTGKVPGSFIATPKPVPLSELVNYRSNLLEAARNDPANAEMYAKVASSLLDDLSTVKNPILDQARAFSSALNDTFTRTFAKTASITGGKARGGAEKIPAEILVSRAFGSNADVTMQRMEQVEDAVKFLRTQYDDAVTKFGKNSPQAQMFKPMAELSDVGVVSVRDAQNRVLRLLAADAIETVYDKTKNAYVQQLNTAKLTRFAQQNETMLNKLGIMDDLRDATHAQNLLLQVKSQNSSIEKNLLGQTAFAQVLSSENPTRVIGDIINSRNPVKGFTRITQLAKAGGPDALDGLRSTVLDYAYTKAGGLSGKFSISAYNDALFEPLSRTQPSLVNIMRASGAMSMTDIKNLKRLINPMVKVETAVKNGIPMDNLIEGADAVTELGLRVVGSAVGTGVSPGGNSLIAAAAGSKAVRQIFDALPNATVRQVMENAAKDPELMALLLEKGRTAKQQTSIANRLLDKLGAMGVSVGRTAVTPALNYIAPEEPRPSQLRDTVQPIFTPQGQAARQLRLMPVAPNTRGVPGVLPPKGPQGQAPQGGGGGGGAPNPSSRSMFQQLFPFDTVSPLVAAAQQPAPPQ
jgi:hypothetical protein